MRLEAILSSLQEAARHPTLRIAIRGGLILTGFLIVAAAMFWWPAHRELASVQAAVEEKRRALVTHMQAGEIAETYKTSLELVPRFEKRLGATLSQAELVESLGKLASRQALRVLAQSFDQRADAEAHEVLALELTLAGDYTGIRGFLGGLDELPVLLEVTEMRLERGRQGSGALLQVQLRLAVYRQTGGGGGDRGGRT